MQALLGGGRRDFYSRQALPVSAFFTISRKIGGKNRGWFSQPLGIGCVINKFSYAHTQVLR